MKLDFDHRFVNVPAFMYTFFKTMLLFWKQSMK